MSIQLRLPHLEQGWPIVTLDDIKAPSEGSLVGGPFGSELTSAHYVDSPGVPVIRGTNLDGKACNFIDDGFVFVSESKAAELSRNLAFPGDIVFTQRGTLGQVAEIPEDARFPRYVISQSQMKLAVDSTKALPRFVYHWYRSPIAQTYLEKHTLATGVPHINLGILKAFPIPLPPLREQRRIVDVLDKADAIRRKRQEAIALTEQLLRSTFLEMFGDPVTNPKRWPLSPFGDIIGELRYGTSQKCSDSPDSRMLPVLRIPNIVGGYINAADLKYAHLTDSELGQTRLAEGDILFVRSNGNPEYIGRCAVFHGSETYAFASYLIRGRALAEARYSVDFVQAVMSFPTFRSQLVREARTTAGNYNISTEGLRNLRLIHPPRELQQAYLRRASSVARLMQRHTALLAESDTLFNSLVQRAFSGQL